MPGLNFLYIAVILLIANSTFFSGIFFMNGQLLPEMLSGIYAKTNYTLRVVIALATFFCIGNVLISYGFNHFNPAVVAPVNLVAAILSQVIITCLVFRFIPSMMIVPATLTVVGGALWVYFILSAASKTTGG